MELKDVNKFIRTKFHTYEILSKVYYLPDFKSKAITKEYLQNYCLDPIPIFVVRRDEIIMHHPRFNNHTALELLEFLQKMVETKKSKPLGLDSDSLPNKEWMINLLMFLDPTDPHGVLKPKKDDFEIKINLNNT